jgi:hypothetical protein
LVPTTIVIVFPWKKGAWACEVAVIKSRKKRVKNNFIDTVILLFG